jgi:hypothetical protein
VFGAGKTMRSKPDEQGDASQTKRDPARASESGPSHRKTCPTPIGLAALFSGPFRFSSIPLYALY